MLLLWWGAEIYSSPLRPAGHAGAPPRDSPFPFGRLRPRARPPFSSVSDHPPQPAPILLRPYQERMVGAWEAFLDRGGRRGLIVAATGTGKTTVVGAIVGAMLARDAAFRALTLAHRRELLDQMTARVGLMHPELAPQIHCGDRRAKEPARFVAASAQALGGAKSTALDWLRPDLVIADEAHHAPSRTWQNVFERFGCYESLGTRLLGVTATPHRLDNASLVGGRAIFEEIVFRYDIRDAIREGFLVDLRGYRAAADFDLARVRTTAGDYNQAQLERAINVEAVNRFAFESWERAAEGRKTIVFCSGVDHAKAIAETFREGGVSAEAVYGEMPREAREAALRRFRTGETRVLANMDILTEGFDSQDCGAVMLLRPTKSWSLFVQMVGRGLRTLPGVTEGMETGHERRHAIRGSAKPDAIIIDIVAVGGDKQVDANPDAELDANLNALVGLPTTMDLGGRTLMQALDEFELLPPPVRAAAYRRPTTFEGLSSVLMQVEMLAEVEVPEEAVEAGANLYWIRTGPSEYDLECGNAPGGYSRNAKLVQDLIGRCSLRLTSSGGRDETFGLPGDLPVAFRAAEAIVEKRFFGVARLAARRADWRSASPTGEQMRVLRERGIHEEVLAHLDRGHASAMLAMLDRASERVSLT